MLEVTHTTLGEEVFKMEVCDATAGPDNGWRVYRSERLASLYRLTNGSAQADSYSKAMGYSC